MRHGVKNKNLSRTASHRKAMLSNMAASLIKNKRVVTTVAKAKALRVYIEPLITKAKSDSVHNRRIIFSYLRDKEAIKELFAEVIVKVGDRPGGYTRILKLGTRMGDNAEMAMIEFVDFNEFIESKPAKPKKKSTRRSRTSKKSEDNTAVAESEDKKDTKVEEKPVEEVENKVEVEDTAKEEVAEDSKEEEKAEEGDNAEEPAENDKE